MMDNDTPTISKGIPNDIVYHNPKVHDSKASTDKPNDDPLKCK